MKSLLGFNPFTGPQVLSGIANNKTNAVHSGYRNMTEEELHKYRMMLLTPFVNYDTHELNINQGEKK